jgi:hypothetical protein
VIINLHSNNLHSNNLHSNNLHSNNLHSNNFTYLITLYINIENNNIIILYNYDV